MATFDLIAETGHDQSAGFHFTASTQEEAGAARDHSSWRLPLVASGRRVAYSVHRSTWTRGNPRKEGRQVRWHSSRRALPIGPFTGCHRARENTS